MENIAQILDIVDEDSDVTSFEIIGTIKYVTIEKRYRDLFCSECGFKLHSKGKVIRHPKHQFLQDGYTLKLTVIGRRWKCSNEACSYSCYDQFNFIPPKKQITNIIIIQILNDLKDINLTARQIAEKYQVSDTYIHQIFMKHVDLKRLPLTEHICIDEVYLNISPQCKYAVVIMDFLTSEIIDILPYINYTKSYFKNAKPVTDSFHVLQWLLRLINIYINSVKKRYQERDRKRLEEKNEKTNKNNQTIKDSDEVYLLKHFSWVLLTNEKNRNYRENKFNHHFQRFMDTYDYEDLFLKLDPNFSLIRLLKDLYESFNEEYVNDLNGAEQRLNELIDVYKFSKLKIFNDFSRLLSSYKESILNSFIYLKTFDRKTNEVIFKRLSNGPMESFNNIPSSYRSQSHGVANFNYTRLRILWAVRKNAPIRLIPKSKEEIRTYGKSRKPYKK